VQNVLRSLQDFDFRNKRVLDVGCRDGLFCFEAERRGAREVIGIDNDLSPAATEFLIPYFQSKVRMAEMNLYELTPETFGKFDVVLFPGVLYHLRYPVWGLKRLQRVLHPGGTLLVETAILVDENKHALLFCPVGDESPYEPSSCTYFNVKGLVDTLKSLGFAVQNISHQSLTHWRPQTWIGRILKALHLPRPKELVITRSSFLCEFKPELINPHLSWYWDGTHQFHRNDAA
jgi:SAM-dependent methyltransferase